MLTTGQRRLLLFTLGYLLVAGGWCVATGNWEFVLYVGVILAVLPLVGLVHLRLGLTTGVLAAMSLWDLVANLVGASIACAMIRWRWRQQR